jgi:DNA-binding transcriptional MerR regulator
MYTERDLERLEQIVALKFLGLPLKQIKAVLDGAELELPDALRMQRQAIEDKQELLGRALLAIRAGGGDPPARPTSRPRDSQENHRGDRHARRR